MSGKQRNSTSTRSPSLPSPLALSSFMHVLNPQQLRAINYPQPLPLEANSAYSAVLVFLLLVGSSPGCLSNEFGNLVWNHSTFPHTVHMHALNLHVLYVTFIIYTNQA